MRLVEMVDERGDLEPALTHLEALATEPDHATRAHYLLGEHYRRTGDEARAMRHYEAVLARDVDYLNVRSRLSRLRARRGEVGPASAAETMAGGDVLGGHAGARYVLVRELGRGATAVVYLARDAQLERDVAVKLLHPHLAAAHRAEACARFFDEARVCASLRHPNIVAILDIDEAARRIVMELAGGGTLRESLRQHGRRPLRRALERHAQILSALGAAHKRGIVHRDLKPANLMYRRDPNTPGTEIMLGDFGVAHLPDPDDRSSSGRGAAGRRDAVGTLGYMSPEQRRGDVVSPRSDLYASAVVLFELLTGSLPWSQEVLLSGRRRRGDFKLPEDVIEGRDRRLCSALQEHLDRLGDPEPAARHSSDEALAEARELRDWAIAEVS
jgi:serine/threonine protein kinase